MTRWLQTDGKLVHFLPLLTWILFPLMSSAQFDRPLGVSPDLPALISAFVPFVVGIIVMAAAIFIGIGAFFYFAAAGNAEMAGRGKELIQRALTGLVLGLIGWVILNTISPQFASTLQPPKPIGVGR